MSMVRLLWFSRKKYRWYNFSNFSDWNFLDLKICITLVQHATIENVEKWTSGTASSSSGLDLAVLSSRPNSTDLGLTSPSAYLGDERLLLRLSSPCSCHADLDLKLTRLTVVVARPACRSKSSSSLHLLLDRASFLLEDRDEYGHPFGTASDSPQADLCSVPPLSPGAPTPGGLTLFALDMLLSVLFSLKVNRK